jgi:hypothetical protein
MAGRMCADARRGGCLRAELNLPNGDPVTYATGRRPHPRRGSHGIQPAALTK